MKNKEGFGELAIILIILLFMIVAGGIWYYKKTPVLNHQSSNAISDVYYTSLVSSATSTPSLFKYNVQSGQITEIANSFPYNFVTYLSASNELLAAGAHQVIDLNLSSGVSSTIFSDNTTLMTPSWVPYGSVACHGYINGMVVSDGRKEVIIFTSYQGDQFLYSGDGTPYLNPSYIGQCNETKFQGSSTVLQWDENQFKVVKDISGNWAAAQMILSPDGSELFSNDFGVNNYSAGSYDIYNLNNGTFKIVETDSYFVPTPDKTAVAYSTNNNFDYGFSEDSNCSRIPVSNSSNTDPGVDTYGKDIELLNLQTLTTSTIFTSSDPLAVYNPLAFSGDGTQLLVKKFEATLTTTSSENPEQCLAKIMDRGYFSLAIKAGTMQPVSDVGAWALNNQAIVKELYINSGGFAALKVNGNIVASSYKIDIGSYSMEGSN